VNSVFIGGSRKLTRLTEVVHRRLENIIQKNLRVLVGDANGTDKAIQKFFFDRSYENVIVYCMKGGCRNNLGSWEKREISSDGQERGWRYYALKDTAMATDASCGFMTWDGRSKGTLNNVLNLLQDGKVSVLYFSLEKLFFHNTVSTGSPRRPGKMQSEYGRRARDPTRSRTTTRVCAESPSAG
jgi:hypothetical protein